MYAPIQNHQLGVSGGNDNGRYAMSVNYFDQQGIMIYTNFKRYSLRANTEFNVNKRVRIGQNFQAGFGDRVNQPNGNSNESNAVSFAYRIQPIVPVYDVNGVNFGGTRGTDLDNSRNPVGDLYRNKDNHQLEMRLFVAGYFHWLLLFPWYLSILMQRALHLDGSFLFVFLFLSFAAAYFISDYFEKNYIGFALVGSFYFLIAMILFIKRESLLQTAISNAMIKNIFKSNE